MAGPEENLIHKAKQFSKLFNTTEEILDGNLKEYVGCKVKHNQYQIWLMQPIKIQCFINKFGYVKQKHPNIPANPGNVIEVDSKVDKAVNTKAYTCY